MTRTMGFARSVAAALVLTMFAGCATMGVRWYVARDFATTAYRTFDWDGSGQGATGDPRLDNNPFFHDRVRASVEKQLQAIGFERDQSGRAELLLHYHVSMTQRVDPQHIDQRYGYSTDFTPTVYDTGTLVLDFADARSRTVVWRGWAEDFMGGTIDDQVRMERRIDEAVEQILRGMKQRL